MDVSYFICSILFFFFIKLKFLTDLTCPNKNAQQTIEQKIDIEIFNECKDANTLDDIGRFVHVVLFLFGGRLESTDNRTMCTQLENYSKCLSAAKPLY